MIRVSDIPDDFIFLMRLELSPIEFGFLTSVKLTDYIVEVEPLEEYRPFCFKIAGKYYLGCYYDKFMSRYRLTVKASPISGKVRESFKSYLTISDLSKFFEEKVPVLDRDKEKWIIKWRN